ncbi:exodeoxyribonuclease VII large subunit [Marivivens marinus]|uniref:exodeoxyribonuclease VII large subunit n=1 Tax=Marivivens marinus TaxID=3110173 RepID=UPI003B84B6F1
MDLFDDDGPQGNGGSNSPELTVSEITGAVKRTLEGEFGHVRVRGEVGRVVLARTGHLYFDLKDDRNVIASVSWKGQVARLSHRPEEGMEVIATGRLTTYGPQSKYQLNVEDVTPAGAGALMAMLEKRKAMLAAEGLFAEDRKKPIPFLPEVIGVVTSPTGAVIRDILHRLRDRFPRKVLVWPVAVQGQQCAAQVAAAIEGFNRLTPGGALPRPDLLIVARGGGSIEDLWGFNEEIVARAAAASDIPLISAVGHETDTTLIDFVSDKRAPTPTAAAELAVPVRVELAAAVDQMGARLTRAVGQGVQLRGQRLRDLSRALPRAESLLDTPRQRLDRASDRLPSALRAATAQKAILLGRVAGSLRPSVLQGRITQERRVLDRLSGRLAPALQRQLRDSRKDIDETRRKAADLMDRAGAAMTAIHTRHRDRLEALDRLRQSLGYERTLERGYAVVRGDGAVVKDTKSAGAATELEIQFADGRITVGAGKGGGAKKSAPKKPPEQGSLF